MFIQSKGKGIMVPIYGIISFIVVYLSAQLIDEYFFNKKLGDIFYGLAICSSIFLAGLWTYLTSIDSFVDEYGEKKYFDMGHEFMFIKMKYWSYIYWFLTCAFAALIAYKTK